jgi:hypothetical protein
MGTRKTKFNKTSIENLPDNKPAVYKILTAAGSITEHLGEIPGATVQIQQTNRIAEARKKEAGIIKRSKPRYNKQGN